MVQIWCTDLSNHSHCHKISLDHGVSDIILQMPLSYGGGYFVIYSQRILPCHLPYLASHSPIVYDLPFNYNFMRVLRDLSHT